MSHTPDPFLFSWKTYWRQENNEANCGIFYEPRPGQAYSICRAPRYENKDQWEYVSRRIIACVNACAGISTEALEEAARSGKRVSEMLLQQRDDLLRALKALVSELADSDEEGLIEHAEPMIAARAAIAKTDAQS